MKKFIKYKFEFRLTLLLFIISLFLNFIDLSSLPFALHNDEADTGLEAEKILIGKSGVVEVSDFYGIPLTSLLHHSFTILMFGKTLFGVQAA